MMEDIAQITITGLFAYKDWSIIPFTTFPDQVWSSSFPSPVITISVFLNFYLNPLRLRIRSIPLDICALRRICVPPPSPPAAPLPLILSKSIPYYLINRFFMLFIPFYSDSIMSLSAPFWAAKMWVAPYGPENGFATSVNTWNLQDLIRLRIL